MKKKGNLLIVDDEKSVLEMLEGFLSKKGYNTFSAESGSEAMELLSGTEFDVVLIDLKLPDIDGISLIEKINEINLDTKCIVMTGFATLDSSIEALRLNAFDYILKPFEPARIAEVVEAAYGNILMIRENREIIRKLESANKKLEKNKIKLGKRILKTNEELADANDALKKHVTRLKMLYQMGRDISSNEDWSDSLDRFLMALCKYLEAEGTALLMFSNAGHTLKVRTSYGIDTDELLEAEELLLRAQGNDLIQPEIFELEGCRVDKVSTCLEMNSKWENTIVPLIYKGRWVGFLFIKKEYPSRVSYLKDYHFINTIQTILSEEVANAVTISKLRDLTHFNETILDNIHSGVIKTDKTGNVIFKNSRAKELTSKISGSDCHFNDLFKNPFGNEGLFEYLTEAEEKNSSLEVTLQYADRDPIPVRLNSTKLSDNYHGTSIVSVFEDLTVQKLMEEELRRSDRLRSLGELSAGVAHEIRNPLTGIATTAQVLKEQLHGDAAKIKYLTVILDEIKRLDDIINNLLHFAKPAPPKPSDASVCDLVTEALSLLSDMAVENNVKTRFENCIEDDLCFIDGSQIKQVILNIIMNGIQASDQGGDLLISIKEASDPVFVRMEVADSGKGIPEDISDKLYNPFFTTRPEGTGLGLAISRKIIESHGGRIFHQNGEEKGTVFVVDIPRRLVISSRSYETDKVSSRSR
ncbi:MAG: response regulator [Candidatus Krumholzibacteriota bacterium]|nr:response regulator [Candidatus Krumholzibacteriota bacterium]